MTSNTERMAMTDHKLSRMLNQQDDLQVIMSGKRPNELSDEEKIDFIRWNVLALTDELHEALAEVGWKPWSTSRHINRDAYVGELIDAWHFLMNLFLAAGVDSDELYERYNKKRERNIQRQKEGYDGVSSKCPNCKRAMDDLPAPSMSFPFCSRECAQTWRIEK